MILKLNVVEIRTLLFEVDADIGLKDICYDGYTDLLKDQDLNADDILSYIKNDVDDFVLQFNRGDDLIDRANFKKVADIMEIIKFQLFR